MFHISWWYLILVIDLNNPLNHDVIGFEDSKSDCCVLLPLLTQNVKKLLNFVVSQIVGCPVTLLLSVLLDFDNQSLINNLLIPSNDILDITQLKHLYNTTYTLFGRFTPTSISCKTLSSGIFTTSLGPWGRRLFFEFFGK